MEQSYQKALIIFVKSADCKGKLLRGYQQSKAKVIAFLAWNRDMRSKDNRIKSRIKLRRGSVDRSG